MNILTPLRRPEYFFRPSQILRRLALLILAQKPRVSVTLPWGKPLLVNGADRNIGQAILSVGLDDLPLCEVLWRLIDSGDVAVDVGANIGMTASLLLTRVGPSGAVHAFEPHPRTYELLAHNARLWGQGSIPPNLHLHQCAVGAETGKVALHEPEAWDVNSGGVSVVPAGGSDGAFAVDLVRLDDVLPRETPIGLLKVDVEGHQDDVLHGAGGLLRSKCVRDLVFEVDHHACLPSETTKLLEALGYICFVIDREFHGPILNKVVPGVPHVLGHMTNILATTEPERAMKRIKSRGWQCLKASA